MLDAGEREAAGGLEFGAGDGVPVESAAVAWMAEFSFATLWGEGGARGACVCGSEDLGAVECGDRRGDRSSGWRGPLLAGKDYAGAPSGDLAGRTSVCGDA